MTHLDSSVSQKTGPAQLDVEAMVDATLERVGRHIMLGTPLGLGKANHIVNAFYARAAADPSIQLTVFTALTLAVPQASSELERRLVEPMNARLFGGYPEIAWVKPLRRGTLPANIEIREFYVQPGSMLRSPLAQQSYVSSNYTHVVRDLKDAGMNVLAQMVAAREVDGERRFSLSCNSDLTVDLLPYLLGRRDASGDVMLLAQVNGELPFMYGDAMVDPAVFDAVADGPEVAMPLFAPPNMAIAGADYHIALNVSTLVRDGGTLQLGIGSLGDAIVHCLRLRHEQPATYTRVLEETGIAERHGSLIDAWGGVEPFERGLYASTEMLVHGFLDLYRSGILKRQVFGDAGFQRALDEGALGDGPTPAPSLDMVRVLAERGVVADPMRDRDLKLLQSLGVLEGDDLPRLIDQLDSRHLGSRLAGGRLAHSCFFLGPHAFYEELRAMPREQRELIEMTGISFVNELYGEELLKRAQRRDARFINSAMMMTLLGAAVSDGLEDGRAVSGVGGQYNFVAMAQELDDGRSILMLRSTRTAQGDVRSNLRWSYGHATIPRHLRDIVVTEYGIADLRGRSDAECIRRMLAITDSRFQDELLIAAKDAGKMPHDEKIPNAWRTNTPAKLAAQLDAHEHHFPRFPSGTDLTHEEIVIGGALRRMKSKIDRRDLSLLPSLDEVSKLLDVPDAALPYLERMGLADPADAKETLLQRAVVFALAEDGAI